MSNKIEITSVQQTVQHNCAISDARYARNYSLCIYLLRMREFYRWHRSLPLSASTDTNHFGNWISDTEELWDDIEHNDFQPLLINGQPLDPFDHCGINKRLLPKGYV